MKKDFSSICNKILKETEGLSIEIPFLESINVFDVLKRTERTGKALRLKNLNNQNIKARSIYDHILSLCDVAKIFIDKDIINADYEKLAILIIYHDLCESIIGDFPSYTDFYEVNSNSRMNLLNIDKVEREELANKFLWMFADETQKKYFEVHHNIDNDTKVIFKLLDTIDPIINIWKYMYNFHKELVDEKDFIFVMKDFFENPVLDKVISDNKFPIISEIVSVLKNKEFAAMYLNDLDFKQFVNNKGVEILLVQLIENTKLFS